MNGPIAAVVIFFLLMCVKRLLLSLTPLLRYDTHTHKETDKQTHTHTHTHTHTRQRTHTYTAKGIDDAFLQVVTCRTQAKKPI